MLYNQQILDFWLEDDMANIVPDKQVTEFPEGFDVISTLQTIIGEDTVTEVGCGYGRLVSAFSPSDYVGYDINPRCVIAASERSPEYSFNVSEPNSVYPPSEWMLMYTVALHIPEENLVDAMQLYTQNCKKVLIAEIMGRVRWKQKHGNLKYAFNRDEHEYVELLNACGFALTQDLKLPYLAYEDCEITFLSFERNG